jgi:hypothetical protein
MNEPMHESRSPANEHPAPERDVLESAVEELERAETAPDDERLTALEGIHARLSDELDAPAGEPLAP